MAIDFGKYGTPTTATSTAQPTDFSKYGTPVEPTAPQPKEEGFFKSLYRGIFEPVANIVARPFQLAQRVTTGQEFTGNFLGLEIDSPETFKDVWKDVGRGLQTVAFGIGGGAVKPVVQTGLKGTVAAAAVQGAKEFAKAGALEGAGNSLAQGNLEPGKIFRDSVTGAVISAGAGTLLGAATPLIKAGTRRFSANAIREELGNTYQSIGSNYVQASAVLDKAKMINKTDPISVLKMYGKNTLPALENGRLKTVEARSFLQKKIAELSEIQKERLFQFDDRYDIPTFRQWANDYITKRGGSLDYQASLRKDVNKIINGIEDAYRGTTKDVGGLELSEWNAIKTSQAAQSKAYKKGIQTKFSPDSHDIVAASIRDLTDLATGDSAIRDLNKLIQSHYDAIDFFRVLENKTPKGGRLSSLFTKLSGDVVGAAAGSVAGQPVAGALVGRFIADKISDIAQNNLITNPVKKSLIEKLAIQTPKEVKAVMKSLEQKNKELFDEIGFDYKSIRLANKNNSIPTATKMTTTNADIPKTVPQNQPPKQKLSTSSKKQDVLKTRVYETKGGMKTRIDALSDNIKNLELELKDMVGRGLNKFKSKKEGEFLDFDNSKGGSVLTRMRRTERNIKVKNAASELDDLSEDPDAIRDAIDKYNKAKERLEEMKRERSDLRKQIKTVEETEYYEMLAEQADEK